MFFCKRFKVFIKPNQITGASKFKFVDASWVMNNPGKGYTFYLNEHIPKAVHFDLDTVSDQSSPYPHMVPTVDQFKLFMGDLGITEKDPIIVYDKDGTTSACRAYWTFKLFNHSSIKILDGGLPSWKSLGFPIDSGIVKTSKTKYVCAMNKRLIRSFEDIENNLSEKIVDARSSGRFYGTDKEPRPIPSGHIPFSVNLPFTELLTVDKSLKSIEEIKKILVMKDLKISDPIVCSCGSGVTASILYAVFEELGYDNLSVYDGSWTEYIQRVK